MSSPSFAKRIRGSFSRESMPSAPNGVSHPMLHLDFGHERSAPPAARELPAVTRLKKQDKRDSKLKNRVSTAFRNFGTVKQVPVPQQEPAPAPRYEQRSPSSRSPQDRAILIPGAVKRTSSAPDRQSAALPPRKARESVPPRRAHTLGASPPLPPLPRNRSIEGPDDPRVKGVRHVAERQASEQRRSDFLPPTILNHDLDGLGLYEQEELILDFQPPMPMPSPGEYSSATASPASSVEPPSPSLFHVPAPQPNKRISFMRKNHQPISRPNSMAILESMAGTAASLEEKLETELSPLPDLDNSRARVAVLRKRGSVAAQGAEPVPVPAAPTTFKAASRQLPASFQLQPVPDGKKKALKRHTILGSPTDYDTATLPSIKAKMEPIESTYKPLPPPTMGPEYCLRPTVSVSTQTPVWATHSPPLRPLVPASSSPRDMQAWTATPPQAYAPFPASAVSQAEDVPPSPPAHSPPPEPVSPSIYSYISHAPTHGYVAPPPRRNSYFAQSGLSQSFETEELAQGYRAAQRDASLPPTPVLAPDSSIPSPVAPALTDHSRRRSSAGPTVLGRSSLPDSQTAQQRPQFEVKARPQTVFNPSYTPLAPPKPPHEVVDYDTPYLNPDGSVGLGAYADTPASHSAVTLSIDTTPHITPSHSPAPYSSPAFMTANPFAAEQRGTGGATTLSVEPLYAPRSLSPSRRSPAPSLSPATTLRSPATSNGETMPSSPASVRSPTATFDDSSEYDPQTPLDEVPPIIAIRKASVVSAISSEASIRRASLVRVSPPPSRPASQLTHPNSSDELHQPPSSVIPDVPEIPLQHRRTSEIITRQVTRRASEPVIEAIPGGGGAVPRLRAAGAVSAADRASKGRSFFLVQALSTRPDEVLKRDFLDPAGSGEDSDSELSSDEESVVDVRLSSHVVAGAGGRRQ